MREWLRVLKLCSTVRLGHFWRFQELFCPVRTAFLISLLHYVFSVLGPSYGSGGGRSLEAKTRASRIAPVSSKRAKKQFLTNQNVYFIVETGESQISQLSGEVHTQVWPQIFTGLVGHLCHPVRRELHEGLQLLALCRQRGCVSFRRKRKGHK